MNPQREAIIAVLWQRLYQTTGVNVVVRNPIAPSPATSFPAIHLIELDDLVSSHTRKLSVGICQRRKLTIAIEVFFNASSSAAAGKELAAFLHVMKQKLLDETTIKCSEPFELHEIASTRPIPIQGDIPGIAIGIEYVLHYTEII